MIDVRSRIHLSALPRIKHKSSKENSFEGSACGACELRSNSSERQRASNPQAGHAFCTTSGHVVARSVVAARWWLLSGGCSVVASRWWLRGRRDQVRHEVCPGVVDLTPHRAVEVLQGYLSQHVDAGDLEADRVEIAGVHAARSRAIRAVTGPVAAS